MYVLEIETESSLKKIRNPRKARATDWIITCIVQVMDGDGEWHLIGRCFHPEDADWAADDINRAIKKRQCSVLVDNLH